MENMENQKTTTKNKKPIIFGSILGAVLIVVGIIWFAGKGHEKTDNAQIDALITPVRNIAQGFVAEILFTDNQQVKKGDILVRIEDKDYQAKVAQAEAALESAKAQLELAKSGMSSANSTAKSVTLSSEAAKDNIATAQAKATKNEKELARIERMLKDGAATQQQLESIKAEVETSRAQLAMMKKQFEASGAQASGAKTQAQSQKSQIALAKAMVKQREAELVLAQNQLENTIIRAPFDGVISKKSVEVGQYLSVGAPICSAVNYEAVWITANFKETQIENMRPGQPVHIKVDAFPSSKISGKLESFGAATGAKFSLLPPDNATGNFVKITQRVPARIKIANIPAHLKGMLLPGLSVEVDVQTN
jgi:membrane fusion protein (multidrug efflux system)